MTLPIAATARFGRPRIRAIANELIESQHARFYVTYSYTGGGQLQSITDNNSKLLASYEYDGLGARKSLKRGETQIAPTDYTPDAIQRLQQLNQTATGFNLQSSFQYNPAGQITKKTLNNDAYAWAPPTPNSTVAAVPDGQNQLTSLAGVPVTADTDGNVKTGFTNLTYKYDALGELPLATGGSHDVSVDYDPAGMLRQVNNGTTITQYLYDGADLVATYDGNGTLVQRFVHGPGVDEPLLVYDGAGNKTWLHADERGSIIASSDPSGALVSSVKYSDSGEASGALVAPFGYTGQLYLQDLQLYYYKARMYSPRAGRFLQPDPIRYDGGMNLYGYVGGDPVNASDPLGLVQQCSNVPALRLVHDIYTTPENLQTVTVAANQEYQQICYDMPDNLTSPLPAPDPGLVGSPSFSVPQSDPCANTSASPGTTPRRGSTVYPADFVGPVHTYDAYSPVPTAPPGVSVDANMQVAAAHGYYFFYTQVRNAGTWDYKQLGGQYQAFGNFNYGATGLAAGFSASYLLRMAGWAQQRAGTSPPGSGDSGLAMGIPLFSPSGANGDDPEDQQWIQRGLSYNLSCRKP